MNKSSSIIPVINTLKGAKKLKQKVSKSKTVDQIKRISQKQEFESTSINIQKNSPQTTIDIFRSDYLRQLCWCLTHSQVIIRSLSFKVIKQLFLYFLILIMINTLDYENTPSSLFTFTK